MREKESFIKVWQCGVCGWYHSRGVETISHSRQWDTSLPQQSALSTPHLAAIVSACTQDQQKYFSHELKLCLRAFRLYPTQAIE